MGIRGIIVLAGLLLSGAVPALANQAAMVDDTGYLRNPSRNDFMEANDIPTREWVLEQFGMWFVDAPFDTNTYGRKSGSWSRIPEGFGFGGITNHGLGFSGSGTTNPLMADSNVFVVITARVDRAYAQWDAINGCWIMTIPPSGFLLTNNADANGFSIFSISNASGTNAVFTNGTFGLLRAGTLFAGSTELGNTTVRGDLTVTGTTYQLTVVNVYTQVNMGVFTNYYTLNVFTTNIQYQTIIVYTNIISTNTVNTYVDIGGYWDSSNSVWVATPHMYDSATGGVRAIGTWDFSLATLLGVVGGVSNVAAGTNVTVQKNGTGNFVVNANAAPRTGYQLFTNALVTTGQVAVDPSLHPWWLVGSQEISSWNIPTTLATASNQVAVGLIIDRGTNGWAWPPGVTNSAPPTNARSVYLLIQGSSVTNWLVY